MCNWKYISALKIQHINGFALLLEEGTWSEPLKLSPIIPKGLAVSPLESARHIREGLDFTCKNIYKSDSSNKTIKTKIKRVKGKNTLSLRKDKSSLSND